MSKSNAQIRGPLSSTPFAVDDLSLLFHAYSNITRNFIEVLRATGYVCLYCYVRDTIHESEY